MDADTKDEISIGSGSPIYCVQFQTVGNAEAVSYI